MAGHRGFVAGVLLGVAVRRGAVAARPDRGAAVRIGKLEALGEWTQRLADVLRLGWAWNEADDHQPQGVPEEIAA